MAAVFAAIFAVFVAMLSVLSAMAAVFVAIFAVFVAMLSALSAMVAVFAATSVTSALVSNAVLIAPPAIESSIAVFAPFSIVSVIEELYNVTASVCVAMFTVCVCPAAVWLPWASFNKSVAVTNVL